MNTKGALYKDIRDLFDKHILQDKSSQWLRSDVERLFSRADMKDCTSEGDDDNITLLLKKLLLIHRRNK